jgi:hypothetical protein
MFSAKVNPKLGRWSLYGNISPRWISDSSMLCVAAEHSCFVFNPYTGKKIWSHEMKEKPDDPVSRFQEPVFDKDQNIAFIYRENFLEALNLANGEPVFQGLENSNDYIKYLRLFENGILVQFHYSGAVGLFEKDTGKEIWRKECKKQCSNIVVNDSLIFIFKEPNELVSININDGSETILPTDLKFTEKHNWLSFELIDDVFTVSTYLERFRLSKDGRELSYLFSDIDKKRIWTRVTVPNKKEELAPYLNTYHFMPIKTRIRGKKWGLALVNITNGLPEAQILLGDLSDENYIIDFHLDKIYHLNKNRKQFSCYSY